MQQPSSLQEQAYASLREWIDGGEIARGAVTSESRLCARLGMSRTPVRAALQRLELEGCVRIVPKHGILVLEASPERIGNALDLTAALLLFAVEQSRRHRIGESAAAAASGRARLRELGDEDPPGAYAEVERRAFAALVSAVRNTELAATFESQLRRLDWDRSAQRRWCAPSRQRTRETLDALLAAAARFEPDAGHRMLDYFHDLKKLWK